VSNSKPPGARMKLQASVIAPVKPADAGRLLPQEGLKEYQQKALMAELGTEYGENTASPPKGRRAGRSSTVFPSVTADECVCSG
jgi:hypothetical protein